MRFSGGKTPKASLVDPANAGEIAIKPKSSDGAVVLTVIAGKLVKAGVRPKSEPMTKPEPVKDAAVFARTP